MALKPYGFLYSIILEVYTREGLHMADIDGVNPPVLGDTDYVDKIKNSFDAIDPHDHTTGKGLQIPTAGIEDGAVTGAKIASGAVTPADIDLITPNKSVRTDASNNVEATGVDHDASDNIANVTSLAVGTASKDASAILEAVSTTLGFLPPKMTVAQRDAIASPANGLVVYNTDDNKVNVYNGSTWEELSSVAGAIDVTSVTYAEGAAPSTPASGDGITYFKTDGLLYQKDDAGVETQVTGGPANQIKAGASSELTISSGSVTITAGYHTIDTEANAATDDLDTISGMTNGDAVYLSSENSARVVVLKHGTGNIKTYNGQDIYLTDSNEHFVAIYNGTSVCIIESNQPIAIQIESIPSGSETAFDYTGIPAGVKRITITFASASLSGNSDFLVQLGDSGGLETSGYASSCFQMNTSSTINFSSSSGYIIAQSNSTASFTGVVTLTSISDSGRDWLATITGTRTAGSGNPQAVLGSGSKVLSSVLDRVRITTNGADTFNGVAEINVSYEK